MTLINSTVSGNSARLWRWHLQRGHDDADQQHAQRQFGRPGGGIYNEGTVQVVQVTNSIIANSSGGADCSGIDHLPGPQHRQRWQLRAGGRGRPAGDRPLLGPLQDNGGPTLTHALLEGSPAIDAGERHLPSGRSARRAPAPGW